MIKIRQAIVVEGKYDKIKLSSIIDGTIITVGGFEIFRDKEKLQLLRLLAQKTGLIILTDSDVAGFRIRNFLSGAIGEGEVIHAYIPDIAGKERRKDRPSAEGKLGVEGVSKEVILTALTQAGVMTSDVPASGHPITKVDFYEDGLTGGPNSSQRRAKLQKELGLPEHLSTNSLLTLLNTMMDYESYKQLIEKL